MKLEWKNVIKKKAATDDKIDIDVFRHNLLNANIESVFSDTMETDDVGNEIYTGNAELSITNNKNEKLIIYFEIDANDLPLKE